MPRSSRDVAIALLFVAGASAARSQSPAAPPAEELQRAAAFFAKREWPEALAAYSRLATRYPAHALSRFRVGVTLVELKRFAEGEASLKEGERLGIPISQSAYRLAEAFAEQHRDDEAIDQLLRAAGAGAAATPASITADAHLAALRAHPKWSAVVDAFDALAYPCRHDPHFREFDFWVGDWDVRPTGQPPAGVPARNTITLDDNECVLTEHWSSPSGSQGQSVNIFDRSYGLWRQTWVDNSGGQHDYRGSLQNGNMVFVGDTPAPGGRLGRVPTRLTFFHLGTDSVRQFSEISTDSGRTWQANYDLMYVRRPSDARPSGDELSAADRAGIRAVDSAFVSAWLRDDTTAVLGLFADDAMLMPPGSAPVLGQSAIRAYWWPNDGTHTRITAFHCTIDEIGGGGSVAYLRGSAALEWTYAKNGSISRQTSRSTDLLILLRDASGRWRISRSIWNQIT